jgi:hypothetical protein
MFVMNKNYSMFALSMRGTNDTFTENARNVIDKLHKNMHRTIFAPY